MKVLTDSAHEVVIQNLIGWKSTWMFFFEGGYEVTNDLINFITCK